MLLRCDGEFDARMLEGFENRPLRCFIRDDIVESGKLGHDVKCRVAEPVVIDEQT
ncbi:hypothetical protein D3C80_1872460 [compost metagenome]